MSFIVRYILTFINKMNFIPIVDNNDFSNLRNLMKNFNCSYYRNNSTLDLSDFVDIQNIMKEGRTDEFITLIQNILQYNFDICTSNNVKVFDSSFIKFFQASQFIINFLLYWKSEINKENIKFRYQFQELDKLRKECSHKKQEIKDLKKQLLKLQKCDTLENTVINISECFYCKKLFANPSYLYAHHKRRHVDQPFKYTNFKNGEIKRFCSDISEFQNSIIEEKHKKNHSNHLKMRLSSETNCLEAQEKFWKGKLKNVSEDLVNENKKIKNELENVLLENKNLKEKIKLEINQPFMCSVAVQTDINPSKENGISEFLKSRKIPLETIQRLQQVLKYQLDNETESPNDSLSVSNTYANQFLINASPQNENSDILHSYPPNLQTNSIFTENNVSEYIEDSPRILKKSGSLDDLRNKFHVLSSINEYHSDSNIIHSSNIEKKVYNSENVFEEPQIDDIDTTLSKCEEYLKKTELNYKDENVLFPVKEPKLQNEDFKKIIARLFPSSNADKLVKVYEKGRPLIPDIDSELEDASNSNNYIENIINANFRCENNKLNLLQDEVRESKPMTAEEEDIQRKIRNMHTDLELQLSTLCKKKDKNRLTDVFRNFHAKVKKNCSKAKKTCSSVFEGKQKKKCGIVILPSTTNECQIINQTELSREFNNSTCSLNTEITDKNGISNKLCFNTDNSYSSQPKLMSVLKKAKSTGNIAKKVAFVEDLPSLKTISETNLNEAQDPEGKKFENTGSVFVHLDEYAKPVPIPRAKKNVVIVNSTNCESPNK